MSLSDDQERCEICKFHGRCHVDVNGYTPCERNYEKPDGDEEMNEDDIKTEEMEESEELDESEARKAFKEECLKKYEGKKISSPLKAIRAKCLECSGDQSYEVRKCVVYKCALYPFRFGKSPYRSPRNLTEEQKKAAVNRMKKFRTEQLQKEFQKSV